MFILYLDEAGTHGEARYFVLAGLAVFEREIFWYAQDLDALQARYFPTVTEPIEFHASSLRPPTQKSAPAPFNLLTIEQRRELTNDIYQIIRTRRGVLFGVAIEKEWCRIRSKDAYEHAFEDLTSRFDLFIRNYNASSGEAEQRGLLAIAESTFRRNLEVLGERFRGGSTRWGQLHTIADVPFFLPAKNTRLLQFADFVGNAVYGRYNSGYARDFDIIAPRFHRDRGRVHSLLHLTMDRDCQCLACITRQQEH